MNIVFDPEKHFLGKLCCHGHEWNLTGKSLRYRKTKVCVVCNQEQNQKRNHIAWIEKVRKEGIDCSKLGAYYLGSLCCKGHDWEETGKSLRYRCDTKCVRCRLGDDWIPRSQRPKQTEEQAKAKRKQYCEAHAAEAVARAKKWCQNNLERARELERQSRERNRDRYNQLARESYYQNKAVCAATQKRYTQSEKGRLTRLNYYRKKRDHILERQRRYAHSEKYKAAKLAAHHRRRAQKFCNHSAPFSSARLNTSAFGHLATKAG
ncbi:hypothetical protein NIES4075_66760 [Tolypothrix sp. NIES-4075]|uniref:hypothetical protein n=1 Tax=Tolypothrix sp. NIES-4075 TaxID=2005459 RepID=UPI000B75C806|nr:hypothetical protein [Tolypothrix sp. NIES-4075]GAX45655.1 hypothetical protein NIES4075_66760 [Tolypothrix sp. NIES-4075]